MQVGCEAACVDLNRKKQKIHTINTGYFSVDATVSYQVYRSIVDFPLLPSSKPFPPVCCMYLHCAHIDTQAQYGVWYLKFDVCFFSFVPCLLFVAKIQLIHIEELLLLHVNHTDI